MLAPKKIQNFIAIISLILAGEMIFSLPFHIARYFRPSFLSSFELTNTELGDIFFYYGIFAFIGYLLGAFITDKFSAKTLIVSSLIFTGVGGLFLLKGPSVNELKILYSYWGLTTICLFWSPLIKSTRYIGGNENQGTAFGFLDGGRGLCAAAVASIGVFIFSSNTDLSIMTTSSFSKPLEQVIIFYAFMTILAAIFVLLFLPNVPSQKAKPLKNNWRKKKRLLQSRMIWLQAIVVASSYACYKGLDHFSLYLHQVHQYTEQEAASIVAKIAYLRVAGAVFAGLLSNKFQPSIVLASCFVIITLNFLAIGLGTNQFSQINLIILGLSSSALLVFGLRGVYFTLLSETRMPMSHTGFLVGLISVIGFTPDIFFAPIAGRLLDYFPDNTGHRVYFYFLGVISIIGLIASIIINQSKKEKENFNAFG